MRFLMSFGVLAYLFLACNANTQAPVAGDDQAAITATVQGFYKWYAPFSSDPANNITAFVEQNGKDARFKAGGLAQYLQKYTASGFVSQAWADGESAYLQGYESKWKNVEVAGEVLDGLDSDRSYCSQDPTMEQFSAAATKAEITGDRAVATIMFPPGSPHAGSSPSIELVKEDGKWLISAVKCADK